MGWKDKIKDLGSENQSRQRPTFIGNVRATVDVTDPDSTSIRFDLQRKVSESQWEEWETIFVGDDDTEGVEGVDSATREGPLTITITVGRYFKRAAMAKVVARAAASALNLKLTGIEIEKPTKNKG